MAVSIVHRRWTEQHARYWEQMCSLTTQIWMKTNAVTSDVCTEPKGDQKIYKNKLPHHQTTTSVFVLCYRAMLQPAGPQLIRAQEGESIMKGPWNPSLILALMILGTRFAWNTIKPVCRSLNCWVNGGRVCRWRAVGSSPTPPVFTLRCRLATCYGEKKKKKKSTAKIAVSFVCLRCVFVFSASRSSSTLQHWMSFCICVHTAAPSPSPLSRIWLLWHNYSCCLSYVVKIS